MTKHFACLIALLVGCSSSENSTTSPGGDAPGPVLLTPSTADFSLDVLDNRGSERIVQGRFADGYRSGVSCERETIEGCTVSVCTKVDNAAAGTPVDPGKITASSTSIGTDVEVVYSAGYARLIQPGSFPAAGEEVRLVGAGSADVAAFDLTVKMPPAFALQKFGGCAGNAKGCDVASGDVVVEWTGGSDYVVVGISPSLDTDTKTSVSCTFAAAPGKGKIPGAALAKLTRASHGVGAPAESATLVNTKGTGKKVSASASRLGFGATVTFK